jgi:hypothetical protein
MLITQLQILTPDMILNSIYLEEETAYYLGYICSCCSRVTIVTNSLLRAQEGGLLFQMASDEWGMSGGGALGPHILFTPEKLLLNFSK